MSASGLKVACWRVKGNPGERLAAGKWQDGEISPADEAEYQRLGWEIERAYWAPDAPSEDSQA